MLFLILIWTIQKQRLATWFSPLQIWLTLAPSPLGAKFLSAAEQDAVHQQVKSNRVRLCKCMLAVALHQSRSLYNTTP